MKVFWRLMMLVCGGLLLLASGSFAASVQEEFVSPPAEGQMCARNAVIPSHLVACDLTPYLSHGLPGHTNSGLLAEPLPDFRVYRNVPVRKARFFSYLLPLVQAENERLGQIRTRLRYIHEHVRWHREIGPRDRDWLARVTTEYRLPEGDPRQDEFWTEVFDRVDGLPAELVLVQAANESAWGTSRFAREGNNLFGQWCFRQGCGIVPANRPAGATYEVARYATVSESVGSYMHNLNTGSTYRLFRKIRAHLREQRQEPTATELAAGLVDYSGRGMEYVQELRDMIRHNAHIINELRQNGVTDGNG